MGDRRAKRGRLGSYGVRGPDRPPRGVSGGHVRNVGWGDGLSGRARGTLVASVVALLLGNLVALASHEAPRPAPQDAPLASAPTTGEVAPPPSTTAPTVPTTQATAAPKRTTTTTAAPITTTTTMPTETPSTLPGGYVYEVTVTPSCVRVGEELTITFKLKPGGSAVLIAVYGDGETHETRHSALADENGMVVWKWTAPNAPGDATVVTQAYDPENNRNGRTDVPFRVVEASGTC